MNHVSNRPIMRISLTLLLCITSWLQAAHISESARSYLDQHCFGCHSADDPEGGLNLEDLESPETTAASLATWALIHDRVNDREMPPKKSLWPEKEETHAFLNHLEGVLHQVSTDRQKNQGRVQSRRLNRIEYENTLHSVLGVDLPLKTFLPEDPTRDGFSNVAAAQQISYHLLEKYLEATDAALDDAFQRALTPTPSFRRDLSPRKFATPSGRNRGPRLINNEGIVYSCSQNYHGRMSATTAPADGWYRIRVRARAQNAPKDRGIWTTLRSGVCYAKAPVMYWIGSFEATDQAKEHTFDAWIQKGHMLEIRPGDRTLKRPSQRVLAKNNYSSRGVPSIAIDHIDIERIRKGPSQQSLQQRLFGKLKIEDKKIVSQDHITDLRYLMHHFAKQAFRGPVSRSDLEDYLSFGMDQLDQGAPFEEALKSGYRALLSSPRFLYFTEKPGKLDDFAVANRLSYLLWSLPPDEMLLSLASEGQLSNPKTLRQQTDRLLNDPRSSAFIDGFSDHWLNLKEIDFTTPDQQLYPEFDSILKNSMVGETRSFLGEMLREDLDVRLIVDSDFTMLNERLAHHYGIKGVRGTKFRRVALKPEHHRGGILTHASIHKVTANGTTTSPIIRGVWLQERILGERIPPPPADVPAVEPDIRGATSIRDQLEKHRSIQACALCHSKIDPGGFALENYDVIGNWRNHYRAIKSRRGWTNGPKVDASYTLRDGRPFRNIRDFKKLLLERPDQIAKNLAEKLLVYGTGASIEFADRRAINQILSQFENEEYGFRSLVHECIQSPIFQSK